MNAGDVITLSCPKCGRTVKAKADAVGKKIRCPDKACATTFDVPSIVAVGGSARAGAASAGLGLKGQLMTLVGLLFAVIAIVLTVRELDLEPGWIVSLVLVAVVVIAEFLTGNAKAAVLVPFILVGLSTPALFFILERRHDQRELAFYVGAALFFVLSVFLVIRWYPSWSQLELTKPARRAVNLHSSLVWFALIVSSVAFSWMSYLDSATFSE